MSLFHNNLFYKSVSQTFLGSILAFSSPLRCLLRATVAHPSAQEGTHDRFPRNQTATSRGFASSREDYNPEYFVDLNAYDLNPKQRAAGRRVYRAILDVCMAAPFRTKFFGNSGFNIEEVRMSKDFRTAYVRWSMTHGSQQAMEKILQHNKGRMRTLLGKVLGVKHTPDIQWRFDTLMEQHMEMQRKIDEMHQKIVDDDDDQIDKPDNR